MFNADFVSQLPMDGPVNVVCAVLPRVGAFYIHARSRFATAGEAAEWLRYHGTKRQERGARSVYFSLFTDDDPVEDAEILKLAEEGWRRRNPEQFN